MSENYDDLTPEELNAKLDLINEELSDLKTELAFKFEAGHMHISPAELELELDAIRRDRDRLSSEKEALESAIAKRLEGA